MDKKNEILLVEDQPIIRRVHELFLRKMDFEVAIAMSGMQAIEMCEKTSYDLIVLDGKLPDISGVELGKEIRSLEKRKQAKRTPVLLLSAYSSDLLRKWCEEAEIDCFAIKPIRYNDLAFILRGYLCKERLQQ